MYIRIYIFILTINFNTFNYDEAVESAISAASANHGDIMIEGGIFLGVSRIRCSYFRFIDRVERNIPSEEERSRLSEEHLDRFRDLVDYHYNCLQSGDNKLRGFGWD